MCQNCSILDPVNCLENLSMPAWQWNKEQVAITSWYWKTFWEIWEFGMWNFKVTAASWYWKIFCKFLCVALKSLPYWNDRWFRHVCVCASSLQLFHWRPFKITSDASQTHITIHIPKAHDAYYPLTPPWWQWQRHKVLSISHTGVPRANGKENKSCRSDLIFMFKESIIDMRLAPIYEAWSWITCGYIITLLANHLQKRTNLDKKVKPLH